MFGRAKRVRVRNASVQNGKKKGKKKKDGKGRKVFNTVVAQGKKKERKKGGDKPGKFMDPGSIYFHCV